MLSKPLVRSLIFSCSSEVFGRLLDRARSDGSSVSSVVEQALLSYRDKPLREPQRNYSGSVVVVAVTLPTALATVSRLVLKDSVLDYLRPDLEPKNEELELLESGEYVTSIREDDIIIVGSKANVDEDVAFSENALAKHLSELPGVDLSASNILSRLDRGESPEEAIQPRGRGPKSKCYEYQDEMLTIKQLHELAECEVTLKTLKDKLYRGQSAAEAIKLKKKPKVKKPVKKRKSKNKQYWFNGLLLTARQISFDPDCEVSYITLLKRLHRGIPVEIAVKKNMT